MRRREDMEELRCDSGRLERSDDPVVPRRRRGLAEQGEGQEEEASLFDLEFIMVGHLLNKYFNAFKEERL